MTPLLLLVGMLACACSSEAEMQIDIDHKTFPLHWDANVMPELHVRLRRLSDNVEFNLTAAMSGPSGLPPTFHAVHNFDTIVGGFAEILEHRLVLYCNGEPREYVNNYPPYSMWYLIGVPCPPCCPTPFPIHPLELCPPYSMETEISVYDGHSYSLFRNHEANTWDEIRRIAFTLGAELASVGSGGENLYLQSLLEGLPAWIGATDEETEGEWLWHNGGEVAYNAWGPGEPNAQDTTADYARMELDGSWTSIDSLGFQLPAHVLLEWPFVWPAEIRDLRAEVIGPDLRLSWTVPAHLEPETLFEIHHSQHPYFETGPETLLDTARGGEYTIALRDLPEGPGWFQLELPTEYSRAQCTPE